MSEFNTEDLDEVIASTNGSLVQMLALQLKNELAKNTALTSQLESVVAENAARKSEVPLGAIENGRAFADRLEAYPFECQGGNLSMCSDWQELIRCFEHLAEWAMHCQEETPATDAFLAEVRAQESKRVYESILDNPSVTDMTSLVDWLEQYASDSLAFAAQLRQGGAV